MGPAPLTTDALGRAREPRDACGVTARYSLLAATATARLARAPRVAPRASTRELSQTELNQDNLALWDGARAFGVDPSLYHLNRFPVGLSPSPVDDKLDAARQLMLSAVQAQDNPLSVIPDATVDAIRFAPCPTARTSAPSERR